MKRLVSGLILISLLIIGIGTLEDKNLDILLLLIIFVSISELLNARFSLILSLLISTVFCLILWLLSLETFYNFLFFLFLAFWGLLFLLVIGFPASKSLVLNSFFWVFSAFLIHLFFYISLSILINNDGAIFKGLGSEADLSLSTEWSNRLTLILIISVSALMDTLAFYGGKKYGTNKLLPNISPNKTKEGFLIAMLTTPLILLIPISLIIQSNIFGLFLVLVVSCFMAVLGDSVASLFKRATGIKDFSNLIPGHGGFLDRLDSHLAVFPLFVFLISYLGR
tara:strand:- start:128404 stop:129246 length:843 start_codon:yes stop_codon:yes gene_type:complete